jgi:hypothetical protein
LFYGIKQEKGATISRLHVPNVGKLRNKKGKNCPSFIIPKEHAIYIFLDPAIYLRSAAPRSIYSLIVPSVFIWTGV